MIDYQEIFGPKRFEYKDRHLTIDTNEEGVLLSTNEHHLLFKKEDVVNSLNEVIIAAQKFVHESCYLPHYHQMYLMTKTPALLTMFSIANSSLIEEEKTALIQNHTSMWNDFVERIVKAESDALLEQIALKASLS